MTHSQRRLRRTAPVAGLAAVLGAALIVAPPAQAADNVQVSYSDIAPNEDTYAGWHQGAANAESKYAVTSDGLTLNGRSQVIKGYANTTKTFDVKNAVLPTVIEDASYDVTEGDVFFQVPVFYTTGNSSTVKFTTLRPTTPGEIGENDLGDDDLRWTVSSNVNGSIQNGGTYTLDQILAEFDTYKTLAFGVYTDTGQTGSVDEISWQGTDYSFGPVAAATPVTVNESDLKGVEDAETYTSWHQGYNNSKYNLEVGDDGVNLVGKSQLIKGYASADADFSTTNANLAFAVRDAKFTIENGEASFQLPIRYDNGSGPQFTTLYSQTLTPGSYEINLDDTWNTSRAITNSPYTSNASNNFSAPLKDLLKAVSTQGKVKSIGFGFQTNYGATISSLTWNGEAYTFKADDPQATAATVENADIAGSETAETYLQWHQGFAPKPSDANQLYPSLNHQVTSKGLELSGNSQVVKGFDGSNTDLLSALRTASISVESGTAELQIPIFFDDNGTQRFATLRPAVAFEQGTHGIRLGDAWVSSRAIGSIPANTNTPLYQIGNALSGVKIIGVAAQHYGAGTAVVSNVTFDGTSYSFNPTATTESSTVHENDIATSETAETYAKWHQGYADGASKQKVTDDGLELVGTSQVIKGYENSSLVLDQKNVNLASAIRNARLSVEDGEVSFQIPIYARVRQADNTAVNGFTTLRPVNAVGEGDQELRLSDTWTVSRSVGDVLVKDQPYALSTILGSLVDYKVLGFGALHYGEGSATVSSIDWDGTTYSFGPNRAPVADDLSDTVKANGEGGTNAVVVPLTASDADENPLTFALGEDAPEGAVLDGSTLTYTPPAGSTDDVTIDYTVSDGRGGSDTGTVSIDVYNLAPEVSDKATSVKANRIDTDANAAIVDVTATDLDDTDLVYSVVGADHGTVTKVGSVLTYTPTKGFAGSDEITYTVSDGVATTTGTVDVTVNKQDSAVTITKLTPTYRKTTSTIVVTAAVKIDGAAAPAGQKVNVYDLGKLLGQGTVASNGTVTYTVPKKLAAGVHRITVWVPTAPTVTAHYGAIRFRVAKS